MTVINCNRDWDCIHRGLDCCTAARIEIGEHGRCESRCTARQAMHQPTASNVERRGGKHVQPPGMHGARR